MSDDAKIFIQRYLQLVNDELYLSESDIGQILDADTLTEDDLSAIQSNTSGESITDA